MLSSLSKQINLSVKQVGFFTPLNNLINLLKNVDKFTRHIKLNFNPAKSEVVI